MTGINGFNWSDEKLIQKMNMTLKHRGPDYQNLFFDQNISFGFVRKNKTIQSEQDCQPLGLLNNGNGEFKIIKKSEDLNKAHYIIVFQGSLGNYNHLKSKFPQLKINSDAEMVIALYSIEGPDCVKTLSGSWAFVIYDKLKNQLLCSRDRLGCSAFFYYLKDGKFIFSSELKGILAHTELKINNINNIDQEAVNFYFTAGFITAPNSIFKNLYKLEANHNLLFDLGKKEIVKNWEYYEYPKYTPASNKKQLKEEGFSLLKEAIKDVVPSDQPYGLFLSGGVDSSTILGILSKFADTSKVHTFSVAFEGKYDESPNINLMKDKFKTIHHHFQFKEENFQELLKDFSFCYDEPYSDYSGFALMFLIKNTAPFVHIVLSGDGGDEVFGGYQWHKTGSRLDIINKIPSFLRKFLAKHQIKLPIKSINAAFRQLSIACRATLLEKKEFFADTTNNTNSPSYVAWTKEKLGIALEKTNNSFGEAFRYYDLFFFTVPDFFTVKLERPMMYYGIDIRSPLLDQRLYEYTMRLPTKWKHDTTKTKKIIKEIMTGIVPNEILYGKKRGFHPPIDIWILQEKYKQDFQNAVTLLDQINPNVKEFYMKKIMCPEADNSDEMVRNFKIRLLLFYNWWKMWVKLD